jgi:hypothetical protein
MDSPYTWEFEYLQQNSTKKFKVELINYRVDEDNPDDPAHFKKIRDELDLRIKVFLDAYDKNPLIPMRVETLGKIFKISMGENSVIIVEELDERVGIQGYEHLS